jgi:hypothetical protein
MVKVNVDAGVCGFKAAAVVRSEDRQHVTFEIECDCAKVRAMAAALKRKGEIDAYQEISPKAESVVLAAGAAAMKGACAACAVPVGLFKAMQVAAGLALAQDNAIRMERE